MLSYRDGWLGQGDGLLSYGDGWLGQEVGWLGQGDGCLSYGDGWLRLDNRTSTVINTSYMRPRETGG